MSKAPSTALIFGREPAAIVAAVDALLILAVSFGLSLSNDQTGAVLAVITAVFALVTAWAVRPVAPALFSGVVKTGLALVVAFGLNVSAEQQGAVLALTSVVLALIVRQQVTPAASPAPAFVTSIPEAGLHEAQ